jgi:fatty acid desaturase
MRGVIYLRKVMQFENESLESRQLVKDARWAIWTFVIINLFVLLFLFVDGLFNQFVFVCLFVQAFLFLIWLLPVFLYQVFYKKLRIKYAIYKALASYKDALGHLSW